MTRFALAFVLSLAVPAAYAQKGGSSPSAADNSSHSGGSSGYSGSSSSSGGSSSYSGGSSHSSGSSGSSSSSSYSGGSSGGSHSSEPSSPSHSGGGSAGSHSGGSSSSSGSGGGSHSGSTDHSPRSNIRTGTTGSEYRNNTSNGTQSGSKGGTSVVESVHGSREYSNYAGTQRTWVRGSANFNMLANESGRQLTKKEFDAKLRAAGLETSKAAYDKKVAAGGADVRQPSWLAKLFGAKPHPTTQAASSQLRPCLLKECGHPQPKPCLGKNCPQPTPKPAPRPIQSEFVCSRGFLSASGTCQPWGYADECSRSTFDPYGQYRLTPRSQCGVHLTASVDSSSCLRILDRLNQEKNKLSQLQLQQGAACNDPKSQQCSDANEGANKTAQDVQSLSEQYQICRAAASNPGSLPRVGPNGAPNNVPLPRKQSAVVPWSAGPLD